MQDLDKSAAELHRDVPPDWYFRSIRENFLQRYWHKRRFEEIGSMIETVSGSVLDIGSADGVFTKVILNKSKAKKIIGIDVLESSVDWAKKHWVKNKKMKFMVADAHELPFDVNTFDAAFSLEVLEHVFDPVKVLNEVKRVLKTGGYAIFLVPSDSTMFKIVWFLWGLWRGKIWKDTHIHTYKNNYLLTINEKAGLDIVEDKKFMLGMLHAVKVRKK